ncbi:helix-turn-helix domain-containing protein [Glycomyces paridis]|uniref:ImmA/IrrE family metallo-endopeptidase n=1 Tax=Glycomyces paridis TaxID=2126555 RepID=A0A4S8PJM5_9ACTN|nr:XRE family transcriptional regulator [Glycomyces paridis]THV28639.1 ImmA/IrrE family metallo-endopeptidase [Glycomyces paridis]
MAVESVWSEIGNRVKQARLAAGFSQEELGAKTRLDRTMIVKIEAGTRRMDAMELARIGASLQVPIDRLLQDPPLVVSRRNGLETEEVGVAESAGYRADTVLFSWLRDVRQLIDIRQLCVRTVLQYPGAVKQSSDARIAAQWLRDRLDLGIGPTGSLMTVGESAGLLFAVEPLNDPKDGFHDGAAVHDGEVAVSVVDVRSDFNRRRTTAAHELGHIVLGDEYASDIGVHASKNEREAVIEAFASEFLLPGAAVAVPDGILRRSALVKLAAEYKVSWSLAVLQAGLTGVLDEREVRRWRRETPTRADFMDALGWSPQPDLEKVRVPPSVAKGIMGSYREGLITKARAVEMMRGHIKEHELPDFDHEEDDVEP